MSHRYSRQEKEKWVPKTPSSGRRSPLRIPAGDNSALIAAHSQSIIGRVTNPAIQHPRAIVDFLPQYWNLEGTVTGKALGPEKFQFTFESEKDLLSVLNKAPYHFKKWMLLLQRWEPIISDQFPSQISFWIQIHDIPTHHWTDQTIRTIGKDLGHLSARVVEDARVRVDINGLQPLSMWMDIRLPSGEVTKVRFEYERLEKYCFRCFSLAHEVKDCHVAISSENKTHRNLDVNQHKFLLRLEAEKRWADDRRDSRPSASNLRDSGLSRDPRDRHQERGKSVRQPHASTGRSPPLRGSRSSARYHPYGELAPPPPPPILDQREYPEQRYRESQVHRDSERRGSSLYQNECRSYQTGRRDANSSRSQSRANSTSHNRELASGRVLSKADDSINSRTPPPNPPREAMLSPGFPDRGEASSISKDRRPALERILESSNRAGESDHLQDVEVQYVNENNQLEYFHGDSLLVPNQVQTLVTNYSERVPASLRLGPGPAPADEVTAYSPIKQAKKGSTSRKGTKKKSTKPPKAASHQRGARSPVQGVSLRKSNLLRGHNSSRRQLNVEQPPVSAGGEAAVTSAPSSVPAMVLIPATCKGRVDFRNHPNPLP